MALGLPKWGLLVPEREPAKRWRGTFYKAIVTGEGEDGFKVEESRYKLDINCGCPTPGSVQDQGEGSSEQTGLVKDFPAHGKKLEVDDP